VVEVQMGEDDVSDIVRLDLLPGQAVQQLATSEVA